MTINLFDYQKKAISELHNGSVLKGAVGSGKTLTALGYYYIVVCGGSLEPFKDMTNPKDLYVITTARKRDSMDWVKEAAQLSISEHDELNPNGKKFVVDSWNNISKYKEIKNAFFIFDEQRVVGSKAWVKSFLKIAKSNEWILISATPGDTWMDYVPLFVANGFFKNRTEFIRQHVVYNTFTNYPKVDRYVGESKLERLKRKIIVEMDYSKKTTDNIIELVVPFNAYNLEQIYEKRWNPFKNQPIRDAAEAGYAMRKVVNSDPGRFEAILDILKVHPKLIIFYNFDYELEILRHLEDVLDIPVAEYNGHLHEPVPQGESWIYLAQYVSAGEAWNCTETNAIVLYSRNYSYKITVQAMGRIDRQNTPFKDLYYYFLTSDSPIDHGIAKSFAKKKNFNERKYFKNRFA